MPVRVDCVGILIEHFHHGAVWLVVKFLAALLLHHFPFVLESLFRDVETAHPVSLQPQRHRKAGAGRRLPEDRVVLGGVGVVRAARANDVIGIVFRRYVLRTLKHEVLEEVGEAGPAGRLILRPHVVPDLNVHQRRVVVFHQQNLEAVAEHDLLERGVREGNGCGNAGGSVRQSKKDKQEEGGGAGSGHR